MARRSSRRALLAALSAGAAGLAGCLRAPVARDTGGETTESSQPAGERSSVTGATDGLAQYGRPPTICSEPVREDPGIDAVTGPAFAPDWTGLAAGPLAPSAPVVGVVREGAARAYPVSVLTRHEVVNDDLGGPLLVTYCPLCRSGLVASRRVGGEPTTFHVTGLLWRAPRLRSASARRRGTVFGVGTLTPEASLRNGPNLVMYDARSRSYWSQILARAICGPHSGDRLRAVPATTTTWGEWRTDHPDTEVLLPPPRSTTDESDGRRETGADGTTGSTG